MALTATFRADFDAFEKSLAQATVKLQVFDRATKNATRDLTRELNAFSGQKVAVEAGRMAEAIKRLGGEGGVAAGLLKLTDAELKRVSDTAAVAVDKFKRLGVEVPPSIQSLHQEIAKLPKELDKVPPATNASTVSFGKLVGSFVTAQAVLGTIKAAFRAYVDLLMSSLDSYAAAELAQKQLTAALRAQGTATPAVIAQYNNLADAFQRTTVFSDDLVSEMQALLTQVGNVMPDQMEAALKASTDLASGLGIDLRTATMLVGKAFEGETGSLKRYGIVIDEATLKAQGITAVLDAVQQRFGGQAAAELDTYGGSLKHLANNWDNLKEQIGGMIATSPEVINALASINMVIQDMTRSSGEAETPVGVLWSAWEKYIALGQELAPGVEIFHDAMAKLGEEARRQADAVDRVTGQWERFQAAIKKNELKPLTLSMKDYNEAQDDLTRSAQELIDQRLDEAIRKQEQAAEAAAKAFRTMRDSFSGAAVVQSGLEMKRVLDALGGPAGVATDKLDAMQKAFKAAAEGARTLKNVKLAEEFDRLAKATSPMAVFQEKWNVKIGDFVIQQRVAAGDADEFTAAIIAQSLAIQKNTDAINLGILATTAWTPPWVALKGAVEQTLPKMEDAAQKTKRLEEAQRDAASSLRNLAQGFASLAQIAGENGLGRLLTQIGQIVGAMALAKDATKAFTDGLVAFKGGSFTAGLSQMAAGVMSVVAAMEQATRGTDKWKAALGGAAAGAQIGGIYGAIAGFFIGFVRASESAHKAAMEAARQYRKELSDLRKAALDLMNVANGLGMGKGLRDMLDSAETVEDLERIREELDRIRKAADLVGEEMADFIDLVESSGFGIPPELEMFFMNLPGNIPEAALDKLKEMLGVLGAFEVPWKKMQEAAQKFGIDLASLGPKFQSAKLKASATEIINAFQMLVHNGADVGAVLFGMQDEISALVQDAKKFGTDIPAQMKPWIEELLRAGLLVDENGDALKDLAGIKFGAPIVSEFDKIMKKIDELIDRFLHLFDTIGRVPKLPSDIVPDPGSAPPPGDNTTNPGQPRERGPGGSGSQSLGAAAVRAITTTNSNVVVVVVDGVGSSDAVADRVLAQLPEYVALDQAGVRSKLSAIFAQRNG